MTDKDKTEELNDNDLDQVTGGGLLDTVKSKATPPTGTRFQKDPLQMETKFEDE